MLFQGLIDSHMHLLPGGLALSQAQLGKVVSREEFQSVVAESAARVQPGGWLLGGGWVEASWGGALPNLAWIDEVRGAEMITIRLALPRQKKESFSALCSSSEGCMFWSMQYCNGITIHCTHCEAQHPVTARSEKCPTASGITQSGGSDNRCKQTYVLQIVSMATSVVNCCNSCAIFRSMIVADLGCVQCRAILSPSWLCKEFQDT